MEVRTQVRKAAHRNARRTAMGGGVSTDRHFKRMRPSTVPKSVLKSRTFPDVKD